MRKLRWILIPIILLVILYFAGPRPSTPVYSKDMPNPPAEPAALEAYIGANEAQHHLKPDNEARIVWADTLKHPTEYAIVYLHGFSASQGEGAPVDTVIARKYGCNLYLSRLAEHGIDTVDQLINLTADEYWESAKQALAIGHRLGKKVILMGTSTGGTLALQLAATYPSQVDGLVLFSPNIEINDPNAWVLNKHWGLQLARLVSKSKFRTTKEDYGPMYRKYWYPSYRLEGAVALQELLATTMNKETFSKVQQPTGLFYYYKDPIHQDSTVKVSAMLTMFDELGTPDAMKYKQASSSAGTHVICSSFRSKDVDGIEKGVEKFMSEILHVQKDHLSH